jgi:hypothetical protein
MSRNLLRLLIQTYALLFSLAAFGASSDKADPGAWIPDMDLIDHIEAKLGTPNPRTTRYYEGVIVNGHRQVVGFFTPDGDLKIHPTNQLSHYYVFDGGCRYYHIHFDIETDSIIGSYCGGR